MGRCVTDRSESGWTALGQLSSCQRHSLGLLGDTLARCGYGEFLGHFDALAPNPGRWAAYAERAPADLKPLLDLLLLGRKVSLDALPRSVHPMLPDLLDLGLLEREENGALSLGGFVLLPVLGSWLLCNPPQADADFYFGEDSLALLTRMTPVAGGDALDLCAGPGLLSLHCARFSSRVVAVELNGEAAALARVNVAINRLADRIQVLQGDLYRPLDGERFDTVVANPPWLPYPAGLKPPSIGHGGDDGLLVLWQILEGLPAALSETGVGQLVGMTWSDGRTPLACDQLADLAGRARLDLRVAVLSHVSLDARGTFLGPWLRTLCAVSGEDVDICHDSMVGLIARQQATHLCSFFLSARRGRGDLELIDLSGGHGDSIWHL